MGVGEASGRPRSSGLPWGAVGWAAGFPTVAAFVLVVPVLFIALPWCGGGPECTPGALTLRLLVPTIGGGMALGAAILGLGILARRWAASWWLLPLAGAILLGLVVGVAIAASQGLLDALVAGALGLWLVPTGLALVGRVARPGQKGPADP